MHSRDYLSGQNFAFHDVTRSRGVREICGSNWSAADRIVVVAPDPASDLLRTAGMVLAWAYLFYARAIAKTAGFFDYPYHYVIGGEDGAAPGLLGPNAEAWWSAAWCRLDVWPSTHHAIAHPDPANLMAAVVMLEPTVLLWPARIPLPKTIDLSIRLDDLAARRLLCARLREIWLYGDELAGHADAWRLHYQHGAATLAREANARLREPCDIPGYENYVVRKTPNRFFSN